MLRSFDPELRGDAWFDPQVVPEAWFDRDLIAGVALPLKAIESVLTPPPRTATRAERRRWMESEGVFSGMPVWA